MPIEFFIFVLFVMFGAFEYVRPAEPGQSLAGRMRNIMFGVFVLAVGGFLSALVFHLAPVSPRRITATGWRDVAVHMVLYALIFDFFYYWYHRAQHRFAAFWQIHELHHSDDELNVTSSYRTYWLDYPLQALFVALPTYFIVGFDARALGLFVFVTTLMLIWSHANIRVEMGRLSPFLVGPQVHRIHHSDLPQHRDRNFAQWFPIYDIMFGTYYAPAAGEFPSTGTDTLASRAPLSTVLFKPFAAWARMLRAGKSP